MMTTTNGADPMALPALPPKDHPDGAALLALLDEMYALRDGARPVDGNDRVAVFATLRASYATLLAAPMVRELVRGALALMEGAA